MVICIIKIFLYSSSVYICHLCLKPSASIRTITSVLFLCHPSMKYSLCIANFLEEISSVSHSIVFLYFFALITEECFRIYPVIQTEYLYPPAYSYVEVLTPSVMIFDEGWILEGD